MEAIKLCRLDTPIIFIEARINLSRFVVTGCAAKTSATVRSEERRVGKECRSRGSPYNQKKKIHIKDRSNVGNTNSRIADYKLDHLRQVPYKYPLAHIKLNEQ